ncbi:PepSY-associated TM region [Catalinimonas alkaloidigena]|uniref:PepSY-associated TM region n=1 Tax=Catalinimonas alkaloidigena TaxID=1075417 RepID=A0A1G8WU77_9BACT|nr:PepSY domain-containing protein [Catalinimonas alkaloidigena]SDJ81962.1 PepSY-associated TM region [Catalinimonas alkaloidigena]
MTRPFSYYARKAHRYLGVVIGIQFLLWTIGGLYFSWNNLDRVHGDHLVTRTLELPADRPLVSPQAVVSQLPLRSLHTLQVVELLGEPVYQVHYQATDGTARWQLASARDGQLRDPLSEEEARAIATQHFTPQASVAATEYLTEIGSHHEYRGRPLPAWAVTFDHPGRPTLYISAELGTFQTVRHQQWRAFDWLWMLHTMDYAGRDHIGNWVLKGFSVLGLVTILSGFVLFFLTSRQRRSRRTVVGV